MADPADHTAHLSAAHKALLDLRLAARAKRAEPVAIVGMACRFPGAESPGALWRLLLEKGNGISEVPPARWDADALYHPDPETPGTMNTRWGGFLPEVDRFDAEFFGISPREAGQMDPQQRLLLEVAWEALEDAALVPGNLAGSATGVFVGIFMDDYRRLQLADRRRADAYAGTGSTFCIAANRISYLLDLRGPSMAIDTACSSSLVSVHLACQSLLSGEATMALAGGVNLLLTPEPTIEMSKAGLMAPDGRCKTFDARADGYVRGEGAGVVVLKTLARAQADGDTVYAVIRGSAVNHDGRTNGLTSPNRFSQEEVLLAACRRAGVTPGQVQYVEAHGTGTALGDAMECQALGAVYGKGRPGSQPLVIGSIKTNIGHLETAAGVAGLIKTSLALRHGEIPASLHFETPNPNIPFEELRLRVQGSRCGWPRYDGVPALAGISSFGFGGTNAHVVLEEAPARQPEPRAAAPERPLHVLALSARSRPALVDLAGSYGRRLAGADGEPLADLCFSANTGRSRFEERLAAVAATREEMAAQLADFVREPGDRSEPGRPPFSGSRIASPDRPRVAFLFTGQGAQYAGMARGLFAAHPGFRRTLLRCQEVLSPHLDRPLLSVLFPEPGEEAWIDDTAYTQPALFAVEYALAELWQSWGVVPDALLGHSVGEYAAACVAGVMTLEEGLELVALRARLMADLPRDGAMAAVSAGAAEVAEALEGSSWAGDVAIAAINGPASTVISGRREAVEELCAIFAGRGLRAESLQVSHAFHSPLLEPMLGILEEHAGRIPFAAPQRLLVSNLTGEALSTGEVDGGYWRRHARQPVRFMAGLETLRRADCDVFIEIGPGATLLGMAARLWDNSHGLRLPSMRRRRGDWDCLLEGAAALFARGLDVDWQSFDRGYPRARRNVPTYPFQRRRHWLSPSAAAQPPVPAGRAAAPSLVRASALAGLPEAAARIESLAEAHGLGAGSISVVTGKTFVFLGSSGDAFFYLNHRGSSIAALDYTGPEEAYEPLVRELSAFALARGLEVNLLEETPARLDLLGRLDFSATRIGVWQDLDLGAFQLGGGSMRRLRYLVQRYESLGGCRTVEHTPGTDPETDREVATVMDEWAATRGVFGAFVAHMKAVVLPSASSLRPPRHRTFLIQRDGRIDGAIFILPAPALARRAGSVSGAYLMDVECYRPDAPLGCLEFGIATMVEALRAEGCSILSFGLTPGTQLGEQPGDDPETRQLFAKLHAEGILNGDANFQFKTKFRPQACPAFLCRPRGADPERLLEVLQMLGDPFHASDLDSHPDRPGAGDMEALHPLVQRRLDLATGGRVFESVLSLARLPFLRDHRLQEAALLPAAAYVEMATAAAALSGMAAGEVELNDLVLHGPLVIPEDGEARVQVVLEPKGLGEQSVELWSRQETAEAWTLAARGSLAARPVLSLEPVDVPALLDRCRRELSGAALYEELAADGYSYGRSFRGVERVWVGDGEAMGWIEAPAALLGGPAEPASTYGIHPALLDACFHVARPLVHRAGSAGTLLPVGIDRFRLLLRTGRRFWVHVRLLPGGGPDAAQLALSVFGETGERLAECGELLLRRAGADQLRHRLQAGAEEPLHELVWRPEPLAVPTPPDTEAHWLLLGDGGEVGAAVSERLSRRGETTTLVRDPSSASGLELALRAADPRKRLRVIHLWALDGPEGPDLAARQRTLLGTVPALVQGVFAAERDGDCRIWLVTSGAQSIAGTALPVAVEQASLWGAGRVLAREHPELWGGLIDLREGDPDKAAALLLEEIAGPGGETGVAYGGGRRHVLRLRRCGPQAIPPPVLDPAGTYLVTGGLGALGLRIAGWLVEQGVRHLALVARAAALTEDVETLKRAGADVRILRADVSDPDQLASALAEIAASMPPLRGVIHAAGALDDALLLQQSRERLERAWAPKILGSWNLHNLTRHMELGCFVLFSSAAAVLGTPGQAGYAAGNAFLDALAHERRRLGLPAVSIGWGPWAGGGMAASQDARSRERWAAQGFGELVPEAGLAAFARALVLNEPHVLALPLNTGKLAGSALGQDPLFGELVGVAIGPRDGRTGTSGMPARLTRAELLATARLERPAKLVAYLRDRVAAALHLEAKTLEIDRRINQLGMDSLIVMELRNVLKADLRVDVPAVDFFEYPTVRQLADMVLPRLESEPTAAEPAGVQAPSPVQVDRLSDDEVEAMLRQLMTEEGA